MTEHVSSGFGNEPTQTPYENGSVIESDLDIQDQSYAAAERLVDLGVATMADASKMVGYEPESFEKDEEIDTLFKQDSKPLPVMGVSVSLEDRSRAVNSLLDGVAAQNRFEGATKSGAVHQRYSNGSSVYEGMEVKAHNFNSSRSVAVEALAKTIQLRNAGFSEAEIAASQAGIQRELSKFTGKGPLANRERQKQKRMVDRTARRAHGAKR